MEGWIRYHRRTLDHWIWKSDKYFKAWTYILFRANYKPNKILVGATMIQLARGEFITSRQNFAKDTGMTEREVRTFWSLLETDKMIVRKSTSKMTMIIVCNYDSYQVDQPANDQQTTSERPANDQPATTEKNVKKEKKVNEVTESEYKIFYREQWELTKGHPLASKYQHLVKYIMNMDPNIIGEPGLHILKLKKQLSFEQFVELHKYCEHRTTSIKEMVDSWLNTPAYSKGKVSVYANLQTWARKAPIQGTNFQDNKKPLIRTNIGKS